MNNNYLNTQSSLSMKGSGYYSAKTAGAKNAIDKTQKVIEEAIKTIPSKDILRFSANCRTLLLGLLPNSWSSLK